MPTMVKHLRANSWTNDRFNNGRVNVFTVTEFIGSDGMYWIESKKDGRQTFIQNYKSAVQSAKKFNDLSARFVRDGYTPRI